MGSISKRQSLNGEVTCHIDSFAVSDDTLDLSSLIDGYDPIADAITDFVHITDQGADSIISVDGNGGADNFVQVASVLNVTGLDDEVALINNGSLVV